MRRDDIEHAALRLFAENGIASVSTRQIAQAAGIVESGLYRHMKSKEELAQRVFGQAYRALAHEVRDALALHSGTITAEVRAIVDTILAAFDRDPILMRFLVLRQHDSIPGLNPGPDNPVAVVHDCMATAVSRGDIKDMTSELALAVLMGVVLQPLTNALYGRLPMPVSPLAPTLATVALRALGCEGKAL